MKREKRAIFGLCGSKRVTLITVAVLLAVLVFNIAFSLVADALLWQIDLTRTRYTGSNVGMYTLSGECLELIGNDAVPMIREINSSRASRGEEPIKLNIVFCKERDAVENDSLLSYIHATARALECEYSDEIEISYVNITKNPSAVQKFKTTSASSIYENDVIVEFGSEYLVQRASAFYYQDEGKSEPWAYIGEQRLSQMILSLTRDESPICALTNNHGESIFDGDGKVKAEYTEFIKVIGAAGYDVVFIDLEKDEIPDGCRMIITFDPKTDFKAYGSLGESGVSEIEKLDVFLDGAGSFFYICDRETPSHDNIEEYLEEWGVVIERATDLSNQENNYAIRDSVNCTDTGRGDVIVGKYGEVGIAGGITADLKDQAYPPMVLFGEATSLRPSDSYVKTFVAEDVDAGIEAGSYFSYYRNGVTRVMVDVFLSHDTASAIVDGEVYEIATALDPFRFMTVTRESRMVQETNYTSVEVSSYVLALSSTDFFDNDMLSSAALGNCDVLLSALRQSGREAVPAKVNLKAFYVYGMGDTVSDAELESQSRAYVLCLTLIPLAICVVTGTLVVLKRRFK